MSGDPGTSAVSDIVAELAALQSRRGLQGPIPPGAIGPYLSAALRLGEFPEGSERRQALIGGLLQHAEPLPPDLRFVFLSACALQNQDRPALGERLERAGARIKVNVRTAWRRLNAANRRVAESLAAIIEPGEAEAAAEWFLSALDSRVDLRESRPVFRSTHTVRVVSPYLTQITEGISFPGAELDADPEFRVEGDCSLSVVSRPYPSNWVLRLDLRRPFACGEQATYSIFAKAPSRRLVHPMSVMLPERECRSFSTEVNFGSPSVASLVWRLDGVPGPVAEIDEPCGELIDTSIHPVVRAVFDGMTRGRVYGLRWQWSDGVWSR